PADGREFTRVAGSHRRVAVKNNACCAAPIGPRLTGDHRNGGEKQHHRDAEKYNNPSLVHTLYSLYTNVLRNQTKLTFTAESCKIRTMGLEATGARKETGRCDPS